MIVTDESWLVVRTTPGITGFVGLGNKPTPLSVTEVAAITQFVQVGTPKFKTKFSIGEAVKITDGPFNDFSGVVENVNYEKNKLRVAVQILGRSTPVELDFLQVAKL